MIVVLRAEAKNSRHCFIYCFCPELKGVPANPNKKPADPDVIRAAQSSQLD
jgi:hypothetical protein